MISLSAAIDQVNMWHDEDNNLYYKLESKIRELYLRVQCTPNDAIFSHTNTRATLRKLIDEVSDLEYSLTGDCPIGSQFSSLLGFDCECHLCKHGPVVKEHYEEWLRIYNDSYLTNINNCAIL